MERKYELVVIGGGPAGITLAKRLGKVFNMAVIRPEKHSMIYCALPYAVEGTIPMEKTFKKDSLITDAGAELIIDSVVSVNDKEKKLNLASGAVIIFEKLVIASGAEPFIPNIPGRDLKGVFAFKTQDDLEKLLNAKKTIKKAVVVGAGAIGIELAQALNSIGVETHVVEMGDRIMPNLVDNEIASEAAAKLIASGIKIHLNTAVTEVKGVSRAESVILADKTEINLNDFKQDCVEDNVNGETGAVLFATGVKPSLDFIRSTSIEFAKGGIVVDERMRTNVRDIYACGDCAEFKSGITGENYPGKLATNAVPMAKILADNFIRHNRVYKGFFNGAATKVNDIYVGASGLNENEAIRLGYDIISGVAELTTKFPIMPGADGLFMKLVAEKKTGRLLGGQVMSGEPVAARVDLITMALQNRTTVEQLLEHSYSAQPYQSFYPAENIMVAAAEQLHKKMNE